MNDAYMTTMSEALEVLAGEGWTESFELNEVGRIAAGDCSWALNDVKVEQTRRFEGASNPDDEAMILAICAPDERRGVLVLPYGPDVSGPQADAIRELSRSR